MSKRAEQKRTQTRLQEIIIISYFMHIKTKFITLNTHYKKCILILLQIKFSKNYNTTKTDYLKISLNCTSPEYYSV